MHSHISSLSLTCGNRGPNDKTANGQIYDVVLPGVLSSM